MFEKIHHWYWTFTCGLHGHTVGEINNDDPDEYTVAVSCACGKRFVWNHMDVAAWKASHSKGQLTQSVYEGDPYADLNI